MSTIRDDFVFAACNRAYALIDYNIHDNIDKRHEFRIQTILTDISLTKDEKSKVIKILNENYDYNKILFNNGKRRTCENCQKECLATLYCEYCIRDYLKAKFSNWKSENNDIDDLIQKCQIESLSPKFVIEWIPYNNLQNIKYMTEGGCSKIYTADWIGGEYYEWDSIEKQLKRYGTGKVILKKLKNLESANRSWFDEAKSHLIISNKYIGIVRCYGLTQDPSNGNYILVMKKLDSNLREYLQENHNKLTWKERIKIIVDIINALETIHYENAIHRDLHSGNILYNQYTNYWFISDLGFCGPVDKPLKSIYGNLPYIAPEVTFGKGYTKASDIYSIAMLMWEVSSGQPPFANYENNYNLAMNTVNGIRPKVVSGTPLKYKGLMQQCWDADPTKRPDIVTIRDKIREINKLYHQDTVPNNDMNIIWKFLYSFKTNNLDKISSLDIMSIYASSSLSISKIYQFENLPEPRNATEEEQEAYHSKPYSFNIPEDIDDFNKSNQNTINIFKENSKTLSRIFEKLRLGSGDNKQDNYKKEIVKQKVKNQHVDDDEEDIFNNPNFHSEDQDELEIPDDGF